jgi:hypothetical protein
MAVGCAGAALVAAGCGLTNASTKTVTGPAQTVTVTKTVTTTAAAPPASGSACTAQDLTATFQALQGSAGAGNIVYTLQVTNGSQQPCTLSGVPTIDFLDAQGKPLPSSTSTTNSHIAIVKVDPGASATSQVRFSPDVDPCDAGTATTLRVELPDRTTLDAQIDPKTKLCGGGSIQPSAFTGAD